MHIIDTSYNGDWTMENKNIIIILIVVIVILAAVIGVMLLNPASSKEATKIKITSDKEQYEGGNLSLKLTDLNDTAISKEIVNITIIDKKGKVVVDDVVKTDSKGNAKLDLDLKKGQYKVNVTYGGNENYTANNTTQKLTIKEKVVEAPVQQTYSQDSSSQTSYMSEREKIYAARQKAADDGIPMGEYIHSPELVEKYQAMV